MNVVSPNETWASRKLNGKKKKEEKNGTTKKLVNRRLLHFPSKQSELN